VTFTAAAGTGDALHRPAVAGSADSKDGDVGDADADDAGDADATDGRFVSLLHAVSGTSSSAQAANAAHRPEMGIRAVFLTPVVFAGCPRRWPRPIRRCSTRS
jgi:hypothetical protein